MQILLRILLKNSYILYFLLLILLSNFFLFSNNSYLQSSYFNSSNFIVGKLFEVRSSIINYFFLEEINTNIMIENRFLKENLLKLATNQTDIYENPNVINTDKYEIITARIINNSIFKKNNNFTLNKGSNDNIHIGQGVIGPNGIVGKIHNVSPNFSVGYSLLNSSLMIPAFLGKLNISSSVNWLSNDPEILDVLYVPKHFDIMIGDTVFTSSFNSVFPPGIPISIVKKIDINSNSNFLDIKSTPIENFYSIFNVYIINNKLKQEQRLIELKNEK